jgi:hypothetical protein
MSEATEKLCSLLLNTAGRAPTNFYVARREAAALAEAKPYMTPDQRKVAEDRIRRLEAKWGNLLVENAGNEKMLSKSELVKLIARWLRRRKRFSPASRLLEVIKRAAQALDEGITNISEIHDRAFDKETDRAVRIVGWAVFRQWLIELRMARPKSDDAGLEPTKYLKCYLEGAEDNSGIYVDILQEVSGQ